MNTRFDRARMMSSTVMQVENNTFAVPSQTRNGKAHIVKFTPVECDIQVPNEFALEAEELLALSMSTRNQAEFMSRSLMLMEEIAKRKFPMMKCECTCEDFRFRGVPCKHIMAVEIAKHNGDLNAD